MRRQLTPRYHRQFEIITQNYALSFDSLTLLKIFYDCSNSVTTPVVKPCLSRAYVNHKKRSAFLYFRPNE